MTTVVFPFRKAVVILAGLGCFIVSTAESSESEAEICADKQSAYNDKELLEEHLPSGVPSDSSIAFRRAYVTEYDAARRLPRWVAWRATKAFRDTPERKGIWKEFHIDPDVPDPVGRDEYKKRIYNPYGLVRGHLVPYSISGGDRDGDNKYAECSSEDKKNGKCRGVNGKSVFDEDDACTVFEVNYMSNVAPQYHTGFNGSGGLWYELESHVRDSIDKENSIDKGNKGFHLIAGPVFSEGPVRKIGPHSDIHIPHSFFKIVIYDGVPLAFLFAHDEEANGPGCPLYSELEECIVSVDKIEKATGLDFFKALRKSKQHDLEAKPNNDLWRKLVKWSK